MKKEKTFTRSHKASPLRGRLVGAFLSLYIRFKGSPVFLNKAIRQAKKMKAKTGKRYRVFFLKNRYEVLTRSDIQQRKHAGEYGWHVNSSSMEPFCFFDTDSIVKPSTSKP